VKTRNQFLFRLRCFALVFCLMLGWLPASSIQASSVDDWPLLHHDEANTSCSISSISGKVYKLWDTSETDALDFEEFFAILDISTPLITKDKVFISVCGVSTEFIKNGLKDIIKEYFHLLLPLPIEVLSALQTLATPPVITKIYVLSLEDGEVVAEIPPLPGRLFLATNGDRLFIEMLGLDLWKGGVACLNIDSLTNTSGTVEWENSNIHPNHGLTVTDEKLFVDSIDSEGTKLSCLNTNNGQGIWDYHISGLLFSEHITGTPAVANGKVFFTTDQYRLYCLDGDTGVERWPARKIVDFYVFRITPPSPPVVANGKIYVSSGSTNPASEGIYCFDENDGSKIYEYREAGLFSLPAITPDGKIYTRHGNKIYCLEQKSAILERLWEFSVDSNAVVNVNNKMLVSELGLDFDLKLYCADGNNGDIIWQEMVGPGSLLSFWECIDAPRLANGRILMSLMRPKVWTNEVKLLCLGPKEALGAIERGLQWLQGQQLANGSWSDSVGSTSMALLAFLNAGYQEGDATVDSAVQYILGQVNEDGSFGGNKTYETSLAILALASTLNQSYDDEIAGAKDFLLGDCWDEGEGYSQDDWYYGGYGYGSDSRPDLSNTQFAAIALFVAGVPKAHTIYDKIELFTSRCQNRSASNDQTWADNTSGPSYNDGGFIYYPGYSIIGGTESYGSMTAAGIWTLRFCGVPPGDARVQAALQWSVDHENCGFSLNPNYGTNYLSYYLWSLTKALVMCFADELSCGYWYPEFVNAMAAAQEEDGHWALSNLGDVNDTCFSLLALQSAQPIQIIHWLKIILASHADLHVYDPQGRHLGMNYDTGQIENNIPGATFTTDAQGRQIVELPQLEAGHYRIELVGTSDGEYSLTVNGYRDQDLISSDTVNGTIGNDDTHVIDVVVSSLIGSLTVFVEDPEIVPSRLVAVPGDESVQLSWYPYEVADFNLAGYNVYRSTASGTDYAKISTELVTGPAYHDTGLTNGVTYYYVVTAVNTSDNETTHSREASAIPTAGFFDFEYPSQAAMETAGWTCQALWHLANEAECAGFLPNPTPFPSFTHAAHFCGTSGTYAGPASLPLSALSPKQRAQRAQVNPMADQTKSYSELITPDIHVTSQTQVDLRFHYFREVEYYTEGSYDKTYVQVQFDSGSWQTIWSLDSKNPSEKAWIEAGPITISVPAGASIMRIKFVFDSVDSYGNDYLGWLIDDISVSGPEPVTLRITTQGLPTGTVTRTYGATLSASGGTSPYTWTATGLPSGLSLNSSTGLISGTLTAPGTSTVTVTVTDSASKTASREYQLAINPEPVGVLYEEDFGDPTGWTVGELWHTTAALGCVDLTEQGSVAYYGINTACNYNTSNRTTGELTSPSIDVSSAVAVRIRFDHFRQVEYFEDGAYDQTYVEARLGDGTWKTIWVSDSAYPSEETWTQVTVDPFSTSGAQTLQLRFIFDSVDRWANGFIGWLVDNVRIEPATSGSPLSAMAVQVAIPRDVADLISVFNVPNPVRDVHTTQFVVRGVAAETMRVAVYDISGRLVWEGEGLGNELPWHTEGFDGLSLANGVYLYRVYVEVNGDWIASGIQKLVILR